MRMRSIEYSMLTTSAREKIAAGELESLADKPRKEINIAVSAYGVLHGLSENL